MTHSMFLYNTDNINKYTEDLSYDTQILMASNDDLIPTISYHALKKSIGNLQGLIDFYFPLQGISEAETPQFMSLLIFVEATIYQIDEEYENHIDDPHFISKHISVLQNVLTNLSLFDQTLETELQQGLIYYRLEQQFCSGSIPTQKDINLASQFKCFDFGVLQRLLFKLTSQPYDDEILEVSRLSDQISKIWADLKQYNRDIERNVINTYRMFVRLYGSEAPQHLRHYLEDLNSKVQHRLKLLGQTRPEIAEKFIKLWNAELKLMEMWNEELECYALPEIPEPILEDWIKIVGSST